MNGRLWLPSLSLPDEEIFHMAKTSKLKLRFNKEIAYKTSGFCST